MGYKKIFVEKIISIGESSLNEKNHTDHKSSVLLESRKDKNFRSRLQIMKYIAR